MDEAIARVEEDIEPLGSEQQKINLELAGIDGRIEMLLMQIDRETAAGEERGRNRAARIAELEASIAAKREQIRARKASADETDGMMEKVRQADEALQELESSDTSLEECLKAIRNVYAALHEHTAHGLGPYPPTQKGGYGNRPRLS